MSCSFIFAFYVEGLIQIEVASRMLLLFRNHMDYVKKSPVGPNNSCCIFPCLFYSQWFGCDAPSCVLSKLLRYEVPLSDLIMIDCGGINSDTK